MSLARLISGPLIHQWWLPMTDELQLAIIGGVASAVLTGMAGLFYRLFRHSPRARHDKGLRSGAASKPSKRITPPPSLIPDIWSGKLMGKYWDDFQNLSRFDQDVFLRNMTEDLEEESK